MMDARCHEFVDSLVSLSERLKARKQETIEYWEPDEPPITELFAALGDRIAEDFDATGMDVNQRAFRLIEDTMASGDIPLVTAVATGLIEAMVTQAAQKAGLWSRLCLMLGTLSRKHAEAWLTQ